MTPALPQNAGLKALTGLAAPPASHHASRSGDASRNRGLAAIARPGCGSTQ